MRTLRDWLKRSAQRRAAMLRLFVTGFSMGSADLVPGVSGGTMALLFGIYEELIHSIKTVSSKALKLALQGRIRDALWVVPWEFLVPLGTGILAAIFSLARLISHLLTHHPVFVWSFFFGLVTASVWVVGRRVGRWTAKACGAMAAGAIATYLIVGAVPGHTPAELPAFFLAGMIAIMAMILPGISGSFLLVLMGKYAQLLEAVTNRDVLTLGVFTLGAVVGLALFSRFLSYMFAHHHQPMMAFLTGVLLGSLRKVWPWKETVQTDLDPHGNEIVLAEVNRLPPAFDGELMVSVGLFVVAVGLIAYLSRYERFKRPTTDDSLSRQGATAASE
ncbi:MAG: DUF368 domain-containing protein [Anaerolineae bacterium]